MYCPKKFAEHVEKQILGSYQDADVRKVEEYNIFEKGSEVAYTKLQLAEESYCPIKAVSYTHLRAHETVLDLVCRLLLEKKKKNKNTHINDSIETLKNQAQQERILRRVLLSITYM